MRVISRQGMAAEAAAWHRRYPPDSPSTDRDKYEIGRRLEALGPKPPPDEVDAAVGNDSWTWPPGCDECGGTFERVVEVGESPDCDPNTAYLCDRCLMVVVGVVAGAWPEHGGGAKVRRADSVRTPGGRQS